MKDDDEVKVKFQIEQDNEEETDENKEHKTSSSNFKQILACFSVYHFSMTLGASSGFSGVAVEQLMDEEISGFKLTPDQVSWYASLQTFAMVPTCVLGGMMGQTFGRRNSLLMIAPLFSSGFICQALAENQVLLLFGRFICGVAGGLACGPTATYVSEASTSSLRTTFGAGISGSYNLGMVTVFTLGAFCHWRVLAAVSAAIPISGFIWLLFIPESPAWYVTQDRMHEAKKALQWVRGQHFDVSDEFQALKSSYSLNSKQNESKLTTKFINSVKVFQRPDVYKPFLIILVISFLQQFSGMCSISYYAVAILTQSGSSINEYLATIIFGLMRFISQVVGSFLLIKFARRHLLIFSCIFVSLAMSLLASSLFFHSNQLEKLNSGMSSSSNHENITSLDNIDKDNMTPLEKFMGILPLISVCLAAFMYHIGLGPIPWSYNAELFPLDVRSLMSGVTNCTSNLFIFMAVKTFPSMSEAMTLAGVYWFYSAISILTIIFTIFFLPETKDKDLAEISREFSSKKLSSQDIKDEIT